MQIRAGAIEVVRPDHLTNLPKSLKFNIVLVEETNPPEGEDPIRWMLVTTLPIDDEKQIPALDGDAGPTTVTITATDNEGLFTTTTFSYSVENVDPKISAVSNSGPINERSAVTVTVIASDPTRLADPLSYEFDFDNDGTYEVGPQSSNSAMHVYGDNGNYEANVRVTDGDGGIATTTTNVQANNVAPTLGISGPLSVNEGSVYTLNLSGSDPGADTISNFSIDWGDGSGSQLFARNATSVQHTYVDGTRSYTILATAGDEDGTYSAKALGANARASLDPSFGTSGEVIQNLDGYTADYIRRITGDLSRTALAS